MVKELQFRKELEVDRASGSTHLLEADQATGSPTFESILAVEIVLLYGSLVATFKGE